MRMRGKIAIWFWGIFIVGEGVLLHGIFFAPNDFAALIIGAVGFNLVFLPILLRNYVEIGPEKLTVVFGLGKDSIKISEIVEVYTTHDPISSSAASLDRIVIKGGRQSLMCAVEDKAGLFNELKKRNPDIVIH